MNERIRELVQQAGEYTNSVYVPPVRSKTTGKIWEDGHVGWHDLFNEKFAELIVQECASIVYKTCQDGDAGAQAILYEFDIDNARSQK